MQINDEWIEEMLSTLTPSVIECYNLDIHDKRACAIAAWNIMHPDEEIQDILPVNGYLTQILEEIYSSLPTNSIVLKGGYLLSHMLPEVARQSHDIDFSIKSHDDYATAKNAMIRIAEKLKESGVILEYKINDDVVIGMSGGMDLYDSKGMKILGVDMSLGRVDYGITTISIDGNTFNIFDVERILSDKLTAILSRKRFRRTKDIYDVYIITDNYDFDKNKLYQFMTLDRSSDEIQEMFSTIPFNEIVLKEYNKAYDKLKVESIRGNMIDKPLFQEVIQRVAIIYGALIRDNNFSTWSHVTKSFQI